ncbi:RsmB/NOP family class I SAM-dependent RNA methyltransferase [Salaquimonas pukyongi]|uniref:RsmB/NOP family class I SAM-dependent RNA methyltransferase n=1 Tax=Salaquimonas pukyongi TaxID=2712698 RepID=UPI0013BEAB4C|nr:transcription antitermination factor NusB [Salaquimonas pukyongi]
MREDVKGAKSRQAAAGMLALVAGKRASFDDLVDAQKGYRPYLALDAADQGLARAITLATLRHRCRLQAMLAKCWDRPPPRRATHLLAVLETALAQMAFMKVPDQAAVNIAVSLVGNNPATRRFRGFANAVLRKAASQLDALKQQTETVSPFPPWLAKQLQHDHGKEKTRAMGRQFGFEPTLDINGKPGIGAKLAEAIDLPGTSRRLTSTMPVHELPGYEQGNWWVQDIAAAQPVRLLDHCMAGGLAGKKIADLCAAPGGKTMQLASLGADVTAVDISSRRLARVEGNLARTGLKADVVCSDLMEWEPATGFDGILLDAPCSATGTIRRHPDILWNSTGENLSGLVALQVAMIGKAAGLLRPGGVLVYANCSLLKAEGENLVATHPFPQLEPIRLSADALPGLEVCINGQGNFRSLLHYLKLDSGEQSGMDGFFCACFKRI